MFESCFFCGCGAGRCLRAPVLVTHSGRHLEARETRAATATPASMGAHSGARRLPTLPAILPEASRGQHRFPCFTEGETEAGSRGTNPRPGR